MPYDDEPYWGGISNMKSAEPVKGQGKAPNQAVVERSLPWHSDVMGRRDKCGRAPKPSPLLEAWLSERGLTVK